MNAINKALNEIKFNIPIEVLNIAFLEYGGTNINKVISLDERIMAAVIRPRVLVDCNLISGIDMKIDLTDIMINRLYTGEYLLEVPKAATQGKSILMPLEIVCNVVYANTYPALNASPLTATASVMYNNLAQHSVIQSSRLELIGENTILVHDPSVIIINGALRCKVEYDSNMSSLPPTAFIHFGKLCTLATKAYIYQHTKVALDQGYVYNGHELSVITEIIDGYSEANDLYYEFLETVMRKTLYVTQSDNLNRHIRAMFGNNI